MASPRSMATSVTANTEAQRELVTRLARAVNGVAAVENRMSIKRP